MIICGGDGRSAEPSAPIVPPPSGPKPANTQGGRAKKGRKTREQQQQEWEEREAEEARQKAVYDSMRAYKEQKAKAKAAKSGGSAYTRK